MKREKGITCSVGGVKRALLVENRSRFSLGNVCVLGDLL
jgi:hypothetical protein